MISAVVVYEHEEIELEKNDGSVNQEILLQPFEPICFVLGIFCWLFSQSYHTWIFQILFLNKILAFFEISLLIYRKMYSQ